MHSIPILWFFTNEMVHISQEAVNILLGDVKHIVDSQYIFMDLLIPNSRGGSRVLEVVFSAVGKSFIS